MPIVTLCKNIGQNKYLILFEFNENIYLKSRNKYLSDV